MMLKMIADMAGVSPDEIMANVDHFRTTALQGVELLEKINGRLAAIEQRLGIESPDDFAPVIEGQDNGQEN